MMEETVEEKLRAGFSLVLKGLSKRFDRIEAEMKAEINELRMEMQADKKPQAGDS